MWVGKAAVIMWIFSTILLFVGYMMEYGLGETIFTGATYDVLNATIARNEAVEENAELDPRLIYTQFTAGSTALFGILTGGIITDALGQLPLWNTAIELLVRFLYTFSSAMFFINIITGRDIALFPIAIAGATLLMTMSGIVPIDIPLGPVEL